jgi:hypothetical protein
MKSMFMVFLPTRLAALLLCVTVMSLRAYSQQGAASILETSYDLGKERTPQPQWYEMETKVTNFALDGKRLGVDSYKILLECVPKGSSGSDPVEYKCKRYTVTMNGAVPYTIPALEGWSYVFDSKKQRTDQKGPVLGIEHAKFEKLVDSNGKPLSTDVTYFVYNTFIDFHAFCNVFAEPTVAGHGIQDLKQIGQKVVHEAAFSEPPVDLGSGVKEGSKFRNGEITLEFKGLTRVGNAACALIGFDSGESSFTMIMQPMPSMEITTTGSSHYFGDIAIDLLTRWVRHVAMKEIVVSETKLPMPPNKMNSVVERALTIASISKEEFEQK